VIIVSELSSVIQNLHELQRMHQLNLELLEQLGVFFQWVLDNKIAIPDKDKFESLLHRTQALMNELYSPNRPRILQYQEIADEKEQHFRTDEEEPVPSARNICSLREQRLNDIAVAPA